MCLSARSFAQQTSDVLPLTDDTQPCHTLQANNDGIPDIGIAYTVSNLLAAAAINAVRLARQAMQQLAQYTLRTCWQPLLNIHYEPDR
jgi:hypothetical protein